MVTAALDLLLGAPWLEALAGAGAEAVSAAVSKELDRSAGILRIPCRYRVTVHPRPDLRLFRLDRGGERVHAAAGLARRLGAAPGAALPEGPPAEGLAALAAATAATNPRVLLDPGAVERWLAGSGNGPVVDSAEGASLARALVARGVALPLPEELAGWLREAGPGEAVARREWVLSRAAPTRVRLELAPDLAEELGVPAAGGDGLSPSTGNRIHSLVKEVCDDLLVDPGVRLPSRLEVAWEPSLPSRRFRVVLTDLPLPPFVALEAHQRVATGPREALPAWMAPPGSVPHPLLPTEMPVLDGVDAEAEAAELQLLDQALHVAVCVASELRRHAPALVHLEAVLEELRRVQGFIPILVDVALREVGAVGLARILRDLVRAELPIRDLRAILDATLAWEAVEVDTDGVVILDPRPLVESRLLPSWADETIQRSWMARRAVLGPVVAGPLAPPSLAVIQLHQESAVEPLRRDLELLARSDRLEGQALERMEALREELRDLPAAAARDGVLPALVAEEPLARWLRRELRAEFPWLRVLAYNELPSYTRLVVQTVVAL